MKTTRRLLIGLSVTMLLPATAMAQKVAYDYKHTANFRSLKTFAFKNIPVRETTTEQTTTYDSPFVIERTQRAIAAQLEAPRHDGRQSTSRCVRDRAANLQD